MVCERKTFNKFKAYGIVISITFRQCLHQQGITIAQKYTMKRIDKVLFTHPASCLVKSKMCDIRCLSVCPSISPPLPRARKRPKNKPTKIQI